MTQRVKVSYFNEVYKVFKDFPTFFKIPILLTFPSYIFHEDIKTTGRNFLNYYPPEHVHPYTNLSIWFYSSLSQQENKMILSFVKLLYSHTVHNKHAEDILSIVITAFFTNSLTSFKSEKFSPLKLWSFYLFLFSDKYLKTVIHPTACTSSPTHNSNSLYLASSQIILLKSSSASPNLMIKFYFHCPWPCSLTWWSIQPTAFSPRDTFCFEFIPEPFSCCFFLRNNKEGLFSKVLSFTLL